MRLPLLYECVDNMGIPKCLSLCLPLLSILTLALATPCTCTTQTPLDPTTIQSLQFTQQITGVPQVLLPTQTITIGNRTVSHKYTITMKQITQKMLPGNYSNTTLYVYSGITQNGQEYAGFPGPALMATSNVSVTVKWVNNITGPHILPVDLSDPFISTDIFKEQVPTVPHAHGVATRTSSDGAPQTYWTKSGHKSSGYRTEQPCVDGQAVYSYPNEQPHGLFWYHDHTYGITRLNVYAGLAALYQIQGGASQIQHQSNIRKQYKQDLTRLYLAVADKSFTPDGQLYYPSQAQSDQFTSWVPEFYGNMMTVNGKVWPRITLQKKKYRIVILNACQCRYLNLYFVHANKKVPFQLIRLQGDYFTNSIVTSQYFLSVGARVEIILDLTQISGQVMVMNNAQAPYPDGLPENLVMKFTGTLMKIVMNSSGQEQQVNQINQISQVDQQQISYKFNLKKIIKSVGKMVENKNKNKNQLKVEVEQNDEKNNISSFNQNNKQNNKQQQQQYQNMQTHQYSLKQFAIKTGPSLSYPAFPQGQIIYTTLNQVSGQDGAVSGMFIDGVGMDFSYSCENSALEVGKVYDFHIINLTPDTHPIHFHLVNFQKIKTYPIDVDKYTVAWFQANGGTPSSRGYRQKAVILDPTPYRTGKQTTPKLNEQVFRDIVDAHPNVVTVIRMKISHNDGSSFGFQVKGTKYVWHCHMLEHQDNEMMKYFCVK